MCKKFHHCQTAVTCDKHACAGTAPLLEFWPKTGAIFWPPMRLSFCRNCNQIRISVPKMGPPGGPLFGTGRQQAQARKSTRSGGRVFGEGSGTFCSRACRSKRSPGAKRPFRRPCRWRKRCTHLVLWPSCVSKPTCAMLFFLPHASAPSVSKPMLLWVQPLSGRSDAGSNLANHVLCEPGLQLPADP